MFSTVGSSSDFSAQVTILQYGHCETNQCVNVQIVDDVRIENTESFNVSLEGGLGVNNFTLDPREVSIYIEDDDSM